MERNFSAPALHAFWRNAAAGQIFAAGGWLAGLLYDHYGYDAPAVAAGIGANILNILVGGTLVARRRMRVAWA